MSCATGTCGHVERAVRNTSAWMSPCGGHDFILVDVLPLQRVQLWYALFNQGCALAQNNASQTRIAMHQCRNTVVDYKEGCGGNDTAHERGIRSGHCVLDCIGEQEDHDEIERREFAHLALPSQAQTGQNEDVDDGCPKHDLPEIRCQCKHGYPPFSPEIGWTAPVLEQSRFRQASA